MKLPKNLLSWIIIIIVFALLVIPFFIGVGQGIIESITNPNSEEKNTTTENIISQNNITENTSINNTKNESKISEVSQPVTLEDKLKKSLSLYKFESFQNEDGIVTLNASTVGNAQYSIAEDVEYQYVQSLAPIVYEDESVQKFIFKVIITDSQNSNFSYTYGCSLARDIYMKYNWATILDSNIYKIFVKEGEIYSK